VVSLPGEAGGSGFGYGGDGVSGEVTGVVVVEELGVSEALSLGPQLANSAVPTDKPRAIATRDNNFITTCQVNSTALVQ
jgi:hypothetical protein